MWHLISASPLYPGEKHGRCRSLPFIPTHELVSPLAHSIMPVAIIPARGGSKRILHKNIKAFRGKPIVSYSIETALSSSLFRRVIVSTDDPEIASIARQYGAETPFIRPKELSDDHTGTTSVVCHALEWLQSNDIQPEFCCCIYATAPFLTTADLQGAFNQLNQQNSEYCFSVGRFSFPVQRALKINLNGKVEMLQPEYQNTRSQDLEDIYHDAGQFYWGRTEAWLNDATVYSGHATPWVLPDYRVLDIDTPEDWVRAEYMHEVLERMGALHRV